MQPYTAKPARYAKNSIAVHCPGNDGYKDRAARLCGNICRDRYSNRERAYILSVSQFERFEKLYADGWDGEVMTYSLLPPPDRPI